MDYAVKTRIDDADGEVFDFPHQKTEAAELLERCFA